MYNTPSGIQCQPPNVTLNSNITSISGYFEDEVLIGCNVGYILPDGNYQYLAKCGADRAFINLTECIGELHLINIH